MRLHSSAYLLAATLVVAQTGCAGLSSGSRDSAGLSPEAQRQINAYQNAQTPASGQAFGVHHP
ncbi:MAG: hypothetical protein AAGL98_16665, partial [Planctomycetota bacterium]